MKVNIRPLPLPGVGLIAGTRISDRRGYFSECYVRADFAAAGLSNDFIQDNQSCSVAVGTVRGLHFQSPPFAQAKLVRVLKGRILDVVVDLRRSQPTYGRHVGVEISEESGEQLYVPTGFAHGFCTLEPDTVVLYKVDNVYSPAHDRGLNWADPDLGIAWPVRENDAVMSEKDRGLPRLRDLPVYFD
ncbi:MAG TPA: dTDP-4-dehydrorhamnose 3,5-epimerase [Hyphomicrobiaceae bacterium]|jgi:dTDP-4-dehydrorhamnose 3,5-epimerase